MKIVKKTQRQEFKHKTDCVIYEYDMGDYAIDGCVAEINGRYPENGWATNKISKEMTYVINGSGKIYVENIECNINEGDVILINPNEKFYWQGNLKLFIPCAPAWHPDQYEIID